ncbi:MAG: hypothetical protein WAT74_00515 [Flavobacteriales bacterium]
MRSTGRGAGLAGGGVGAAFCSTGAGAGFFSVFGGAVFTAFAAGGGFGAVSFFAATGALATGFFTGGFGAAGCFAIGFDAVFGFGAGRFAGLAALDGFPAAGFFTGFAFLAAGAAFFALPFLAAALIGLRALAVEDFFFAGAGRLLVGFLPLLALSDFFFAISRVRW